MKYPVNWYIGRLVVLIPALLAGLGCWGCDLLSPPERMVVVLVTATPGAGAEGEAIALTPPPPSTPTEGRSHTEGTSAPMLLINEVSVLSQTVVITFTVAGDGPQALLFDTPRLDGQPATPDSLEAAHFALLDRITQGQATASLAFLRPQEEPPWVLVFNPGHEPGDYVAPRMEVEVEP